MSSSLLEHLERLNDLVEEVIRENNELKRRCGGDVAALANAIARNDRANRKRLTAGEVARIREMKREGFSQKEIADAFDINQGTVSRIVRNQYHKES